METYKAAFVDYLRRALAERGEGAEAAMLAKLSPDDQQRYRSLLPMTWISPELGGRILEAAGPILFPDARDPVFELGRAQAHNDVNGLYRVLLKVVTVPMVIKRSAQLFGAYHKKGEALIEHEEGTRRGVFVVRNYPELAPTIRRTVGGFVLGLLELTGAKQIGVQADERDPQAWRWEISWS